MILLLFTPYGSTPGECADAFQTDAFQDDAFQICEPVPTTGGGHPGWRARRIIDVPADQNDLAIILLLT